jgi:hypothetical protein
MKKLSILIFFLFVTFNSFAKYTQTCTVKYETQEGWSKKYVVDVTFLTGAELNDATSSYKYSSYSAYAVIFWEKVKQV